MSLTQLNTMNIRLGSRVIADDGEAGEVERLVLHPETRELDALLVTQGEGPELVIVPLDRVTGANDDHVRVAGAVEEIHDLPLFAHSQFVEPPEEWLSPVGTAAGFYLIPASPIAVGAFESPSLREPPQHEIEQLKPGDFDVSGSTRVFCADGVAGRLERVGTEGDTDRVTHLVVHRGSLRGRDVPVPVDDIANVDDEGIHLALTCAQVDTLPHEDH